MTLEADIRDAIRYVNGERDDAAEDAFYEVERLAMNDPRAGLRIIQDVVNGIEPNALGVFGAGFLENYLGACTEEVFDDVFETIIGNARLIKALRSVRSFDIPWDLALKLSPLVRQ